MMHHYKSKDLLSDGFCFFFVRIELVVKLIWGGHQCQLMLTMLSMLRSAIIIIWPKDRIYEYLRGSLRHLNCSWCICPDFSVACSARSAISLQEPRVRVLFISRVSSVYHDICYLVPLADTNISNDSRSISLIRIKVIKWVDWSVKLGPGNNYPICPGF